jgi:DNA-binding IclR family transcriptional regulator
MTSKTNLSASGRVTAAREQKRETVADETSGTVKSANRVLDLFELLAHWGREMSHAELAEALGIPKSSLTQLLKTLVARGYIDYSPSNKSYQLGDAFARLSQRTGDARNLITFIEPILEEITRATQESCALNHLRGSMTEVVASVSSPQRLVSHMRTGDLAPLYATSGGKTILAHLPEAMREEYIATVQFERITPKTIRSRKELQKHLTATRKEGFAYSFEEFTPGIVGIGAPILSEAGFPLGSLNIAMPAVRYTAAAKARAENALQDAVQRIRRHFVSGR